MISFLLTITLGLCTAASRPSANGDNFLPNGSFESGMEGWRLDNERPKGTSKGHGEIVHDHVCHGQAAFHLEKTADDPWLPELWCQPFPVKPDGYYEITAQVEASGAFMLRYAIATKDHGSVRSSESFPPTQGWQPMAVRFHAPADTKTVYLGLLLRAPRGQMWIDDVRVQATAPFAEPPEVPQAETAKADPRQRLVELARRTRIKPQELLRSSDGHFPSERLVFCDTATGLVLWKLTHNPGINSHGYSNVPVWNADGSRMLLRGDRPGSLMWWLVAPDGSQWTPFPKECHGWIYWSPLDRNVVWSADEPQRGSAPEAEIYETDVSTGQSRLRWRLPMATRDWKVLPPSHDGKKFLVREQGPGPDGKPRGFAVLVNADGSGQPQRFDLGTVAGQTWFLKRPDYSFMFATDRDVRNHAPDRQWVCEPAKNGAVRVLDGREHFNHAGVSPSGKWIAFQTNPGGVWITNVDSGARHRCVRGPHSGGGHLSWECDDRWLVASMGNGIYEIWVEGEHPPRLLCVPNTHHSMRTECEPESSPDGTKFAYVSSMLGDGDVYVGVQRLPDPPRNVRRQGRALSWDPPVRCRELAGYGVYRGEELLNREPIRECRYEVPQEEGQYTVVAIEHSGLQSACPDHRPPPAPAQVAAEAKSPFVVELSWQPAAANDVSYYNVYCACGSQPAGGQESRIASPSEPRLLDWGLQAGKQYHYLVTAVDRAGNESPTGARVAVQTPAIQRVQERVAVNQPLGKEPLAIPLHAPRNDRYLVWIELKAGGVASNQYLSARFDKARSMYWDPSWGVVCVGHDNPQPIPFSGTLQPRGKHDPWHTLDAGNHRLELSLPKGSAEVLSVTLTNDAGFVPEGITCFVPDSNP